VFGKMMHPNCKQLLSFEDSTNVGQMEDIQTDKEDIQTDKSGLDRSEGSIVKTTMASYFMSLRCKVVT
jgi:hypothetical protein